ncbi:hypothetical protein D3C80_1688930 [compost metagenome]
MVVQRTEEYLEPALQHHIEEMITTERRKHYFAALQFAGAEILQKLFQAGRSHILEQSEMMELLDALKPLSCFHNAEARGSLSYPCMCTTDSPCSPICTLKPEY